MLPMNCQITAENVITPSFDQMCVAEPANYSQIPTTISPSTSLVNNNNNNGNDLHCMDCMIPLSRLPGNN